MQRDFILVVGAQGFGKTVWTQTYCAQRNRLLVYDPKAEYRGVDFLADPEEWVPRVVSRELETFRFGTYLDEEIEMFGNAAYAAGNCTLVMEECALLFNRGEDIADWARPLVFMGREPRLNLVLVAQRAHRIPIDIRSQASRIITFSQTEPDDVRALCSRIGREHENAIRALPPLQCLDWKQGEGVATYTVRP